jgi:prostaglandin-endoperoxide synthase 2
MKLCPKSTLLFPAFAQYLTDGFIRTKMSHTGTDTENLRQNTSNHQIDLCPLYGRTPSQTLALRLCSEAAGQRGRLKSQMINGEEYAPFLCEAGVPKAEFAALDQPLGFQALQKPENADRLALIFAFGGDRVNTAPQVSMLNTLLLREHNRLAAGIEARHPAWDDTRVFETARNVVIVEFIKIVVEDYINHIAPTPFPLRADPSVAWTAPWNKPNWITTEFSLLYRWHALIPDDVTWNGTSYPLAATLRANRLLIDGGLAQGFIDMSAQPAGAIGLFNTVSDLVDVEMRSIFQGRFVNLAPYTDYRDYAGLPRPKTFEDISGNPDITDALRRAYGTPDKVDFYVGLFAEDTVANSPLPELLMRMVAVDAFSQALTNPLLSEHVFNPDTFSQYGWDDIQATHSLRDLVARNVPQPLGDAFIGMTRPDWRYVW